MRMHAEVMKTSIKARASQRRMRRRNRYGMMTRISSLSEVGGLLRTIHLHLRVKRRKQRLETK
jgi:hypothetical protein